MRGCVIQAYTGMRQTSIYGQTIIEPRLDGRWEFHVYTGIIQACIYCIIIIQIILRKQNVRIRREYGSRYDTLPSWG